MQIAPGSAAPQRGEYLDGIKILTGNANRPLAESIAKALGLRMAVVPDVPLATVSEELSARVREAVTSGSAKEEQLGAILYRVEPACRG